MRKLIYFIRHTWVVVLFVVVEFLAIRAYAYSTPYTQARLLGWSNSVVGAVRGAMYGVRGFFALRGENERLAARVAELENILEARGGDAAQEDVALPDMFRKYEYMSARVVSNSISRPKNFLTLNKGFADGVSTDMAVLSPEGAAVGTVVDCSEHYAVVRTLLNTDFRVSGVLAEDGSPGAILWRGEDVQMVDFDGVPKYAHIEVGDKVLAAGFSHYFPPQAMIGTIEHAEVVGNTYHCRVRLVADMARLQNVILVNNTMAGEAQHLEQGYK